MDKSFFSRFLTGTNHERDLTSTTEHFSCLSVVWLKDGTYNCKHLYEYLLLIPQKYVFFESSLSFLAMGTGNRRVEYSYFINLYVFITVGNYPYNSVVPS